MIYFFMLMTFFSALVRAELPGDSIYQVNSEWNNQLGAKLSLQNLQGKIVIVSMVYMGCHYACPMTVARMKEIEKHLHTKVKNQVQFVLVSFDPKNDTPEMMHKFAVKNHLDPAQWIFITTENESNLREFSTLIDFQYKSTPTGDFEHSNAIIALDRQGRIIGRTEGANIDPKQLAELINKLK